MAKGLRSNVVAIIGAIAVVGGGIAYFISGNVQDRDTSREFLTNLTGGNVAGAYDLLHDEVTATLSLEGLSDLVAEAAPLVEINFPSTSFSNNNGTRLTELSGTATTSDGCESAVEVELLNGEVTYFDVTPLCLATPADA